MSIKIFVSHAAADEALAAGLVDCLLSSMILRDSDIRCTSVPGHKLPVGSEFAVTLRDEIGETSIVIGLITRKALSSGWVLFELGATWGARKHLKPLISDEVDFKELPGPLSGQHVARLSNRNDLAQFIEEVTHLVSAKPRSRAKINNAIDQLITIHAEHMKALSQSTQPRQVETKLKEPVIAGMPFSELLALLHKESIKIPKKLSGKDQDIEIPVR